MILQYFLLIIMTLLGSIAAYFLKIASNSDCSHLFFSPFLYLGGGLYFLSAMLNILLLKHMEYSLILPLTSITYIWTMIISYRLLNEKMTIQKIIGILFIIVGSIALI